MLRQKEIGERSIWMQTKGGDSCERQNELRVDVQTAVVVAKISRYEAEKTITKARNKEQLHEIVRFGFYLFLGSLSISAF